MGHHDTLRISQRISATLFDVVVIRSWWVAVFILLCAFLYDQAASKRALEEQRLHNKLLQLEDSLLETRAKNAELRLRNSSQSDPASIELILMHRLGLVPEGNQKVIFS